MLMVTNLSYIQSNFPKEPYSIWLKLKTDTKSQVVYDSISKNKVNDVSCIFKSNILSMWLGFKKNNMNRKGQRFAFLIHQYMPSH